MDHLSAATTLATLVGLICNFRQEKGARESLNHQKFVEWLEYHRHEELKNLIINTSALRTEVDNLLRADHALMLQKLDDISNVLASLMSRLGEFRGLALTIAPGAELSEQALSILQQFALSGAEYFYYSSYGDGNFSLGVPNGEQFGVTEVRLIRDDLEKLVGLGLLSVEYNSQGEPLFHITRNAIRFVEAMEQKPVT